MRFARLAKTAAVAPGIVVPAGAATSMRFARLAKTAGVAPGIVVPAAVATAMQFVREQRTAHPAPSTAAAAQTTAETHRVMRRSANPAPRIAAHSTVLFVVTSALAVRFPMSAADSAKRRCVATIPFAAIRNGMMHAFKERRLSAGLPVRRCVAMEPA